MNRTGAEQLQGVLFAVIATFCWASNFISPYVTGAFSIYDLVLVRYLFVGVLGVMGVYWYRRQVQRLSWRQCLLGMTLGTLGYLFYSMLIAGSVIFGGPTMIAAFIGCVPALQATVGNLNARHLSWSHLAVALALLSLGLVLINLEVLGAERDGQSGALGLLFCTGSVATWICFSVINQKALAQLPDEAMNAWTSLMMVGAGVVMLLLMPAMLGLNLLTLTAETVLSPQALTLYGWAMAIGLFSSIVGAGAWNVASSRLPMVLSGQLIALESVFAVMLGLAFIGRMPSLLEVLGLLLVLAGTLYAIRQCLAPTLRLVSTPNHGTCE